eukprot:442509-Rhodomonas_salina.6
MLAQGRTRLHHAAMGGQVKEVRATSEVSFSRSIVMMMIVIIAIRVTNTPRVITTGTVYHARPSVRSSSFSDTMMLACMQSSLHHHHHRAVTIATTTPSSLAPASHYQHHLLLLLFRNAHPPLPLQNWTHVPPNFR